MNNHIKHRVAAACIITVLGACSGSSHDQEAHAHGEGEAEKKEVHFSMQQFDALGLRVNTVPLRNLSATVEANGELEVPPQNEATVTTMIGANIRVIKVIEGDKIKKGQVLAWLSHPNLIRLQTEYLHNRNQLAYLALEYNRQKRLYDEEVGSGREFQKTHADYESAKGDVKGLESELKLLGLNLKRIQDGNIYESVPVRSPIDGHIKKINVKTGRYVEPQYEMFEVVNTDHVHADLMVFEKDVHKVHEGQKVRFTVQTVPGEEMEAEIYAVGVSFESAPKAVHIHAEIENKKGLLIPGMYVKGRVIVDDIKTYALPEDALVQEGERSYIFSARKNGNDAQEAWTFSPVEVVPGIRDDGWVEVRFLKAPAPAAMFVMNNAYYLQAEMKKEEGGHHH